MKLLATLLFLFIYIPAWAATYNVASSGGDFSTIAQVNAYDKATGFLPDDNIVFADDQVWRETLRCWSSGTAGHPITYKRSGTGTNKPIIRGSDLVAVGSWTADGSDWYWQPPTNGAGSTRIQPMQVWENETRLTWVTTITGNGQWTWDDVNKRVYIRPTDGTLNDEVMEVGQRCQGIAISHSGGTRAKANNHHIVIDGIQVEKVAGTGDDIANPYTDGVANLAYSIIVSQGYSTIVKNCTVKQMGGGVYYDGEVSGSNWSSGIEFWNSYDCIANDNTVYDGHCVGIDPEYFSSGDPYVCFNNTIYDIDGCGLHTAGTNTYNLVWYNNTISNCGNNHTYATLQRGMLVSGGTLSTKIYDNIITDCRQGMRIYGTQPSVEYSVYNNIISNFTNWAVRIQGSNITNLGFYHNTLIDNGTSNDTMFLMDSSTNVTCSVKNNIFYQASNQKITSRHSSVNATLDYNDFYRTTAGNAFLDNATTYTFANFTTYKSATSQDSHSIAADPILSSRYRLKTGSPAINAGVGGLNVTTDYLGNTRDNLPDIGCMEAGNFFNANNPLRNCTIGN